MSDFALLDGSSMSSAGSVPAAGSGTSLALPTVLNTMGAWTTIVASTPAEAVGMVVNLSVYVGTGVPEVTLIDIGVGAAASEQVIVPQLYLATNGTPWWGMASYYIPIAVASGSRLSARYQVQGQITSNAYAYFQMISGGLGSSPPLSRVTAYGTVPASTTVTSVPGNASAYVKGAWTQLVASTTNAIQNLSIATRANGNTGFVDIGVGAAASEQIIIPDLMVPQPDPNSTATWTLPVSVPAGTRLSARFLSNVPTDTCKVGLWGID